MRRRAALLAAALCLALPGCQTRDQIVFPQTGGMVIDGLTGEPATGARVAAVEAPVETGVSPDGSFSLPATRERRTRIVLPASGVYVALAPLKAEAGDARAYGQTTFVSIGEIAEQDVWLFLLPRSLPFSGNLPATCEATDEEAYGLQLMSADMAQSFHDWLGENAENQAALEAHLTRLIFPSLPERCGLSTGWQIEMREAIRAFAGTS